MFCRRTSSRIDFGFRAYTSFLTLMLLTSAAMVLSPISKADDNTAAAWVETAAGGTIFRLSAPPGQKAESRSKAGLYRLHDISGPGVELLGAYVTPQTSQFLADSGTLPPPGLLSTVVVTDRELVRDPLRQDALRHILVQEMTQEKRLAAFLAAERFGLESLQVSLPRMRLLAVEDQLVMEGRERLLPGSTKRISYCVEALLSLSARPVFASMCLMKPDVTRADMHHVETVAGNWARKLLAENPTVAWNRVNASSRGGPAASELKGKTAALANLRDAVKHRSQDILVASALLWGTLASTEREAFGKSNQRFAKNVRETCGAVSDKVAASQCELLALEQRLHALDRSIARIALPEEASESVQPPTVQLIGT